MVQEESLFSYFNPFGVRYSQEAESDLALWAAVFKQAVTDYVEALRFDRAGARSRNTVMVADDRKTIYDWFDSDDENPGSLVWLCHLFGQDVEHVRATLNRNWRTLHLNKPRGKHVKKSPAVAEEDEE